MITQGMDKGMLIPMRTMRLHRSVRCEDTSCHVISSTDMPAKVSLTDTNLDLASMLRTRNRLFDESVTMEDTSVIFFLVPLVHSFVMPVAGVLQLKWGLRLCAALGGGLVGLSALLSSLSRSVSELAVLSGMFGLGIALA